MMHVRWHGLMFGLALLAASFTLTGCPSQEVVVIDNLSSVSVEEVWSDVVSFFTGGESTPFEVGDIIVGSSEGGFLRRVLAINQDDDQVTTETEFVSLAEAIDAGSLNGTVTFTADDFAKAKVPLAKSSEMTIDLSGITLFSKDGVTVTLTTGTITYAPTVILKAVFADHELSSFEASTEGDLTLNVDVRVTAAAGATLNWETEVIPAITKPFVFYIGPVPVAGTASLRLPFGITGTIGGEASVTSGFDDTTHIKVGMKMNDGAWSSTTGFGAFEPTAHPIVVSLGSDAGVDIYVKPTVGLNLYGASDLTGYVQPYLAADAQFIPSPFTFNLSAGINAGIGYELSIFDFTLIDKDWNFPGPQWQLYHYEIPYDIPTTFTFTLP